MMKIVLFLSTLWMLVNSHNPQYYVGHPKVFSHPLQQQKQQQQQLHQRDQSEGRARVLEINPKSEHRPPLSGDPSCKCLLSEEVDSLEPSHLDRNVLNDLASSSSSFNLTTYGFGCQTHDAMREVCRCDSPTDTACSTIPPWCYQEWCWVDGETCQLKNDKWTEAAVSTSHDPNKVMEIRYYSYATCRNEDRYTSDVLKKQLSQRTIRVAFGDNRAGYLGVYSRTGGLFPKEVRGPLMDFMSASAERGNFTMEVVQPSMQYRNRSIAIGAASPNDYCIYMAALGFVDVCVSFLLLTNFRTSIADWMVMGQDEIKLIVPVDKKYYATRIETILLAIETVFSPFTIPCWTFMTLVVVPVLGGLLFIFHEYGRPESVYPRYEKLTIRNDEDGQDQVHYRKYSILRHFILSLYTGTLGLWQTAYQSRVTTPGAKIHLVGYSFFVFAFVSVYAANLSAILLERRTFKSVSSLHDVVDRRLRICTIRKFYEIVSTLHNVPDSLFAVDPVEEGGDGKPGFDCATCGPFSRVYDFIDPTKADNDERYCHVGLTFEQSLIGLHHRKRHCNKTLVGAGIGSASYGLPIFETVSDELKAVMQEVKNDGVWFSLVANSKPETKCGIQSASNANGADGYALTIEELSGIWFGVAVFSFLGLVASGITRLRARVQVNKGAIMPIYDQFGLPVEEDDDILADIFATDNQKDELLSDTDGFTEAGSQTKPTTPSNLRGQTENIAGCADVKHGGGEEAPSSTFQGSSPEGDASRQTLMEFNPGADTGLRSHRKKKKSKKRRKEGRKSRLDRLLSSHGWVVPTGEKATVVSEVTFNSGKALRPLA